MERGQVNKQMKSIAYPIAAIAGTGLVLGAAALALGWLEVGISISPVGPDASVVSGAAPLTQKSATEVAMRSTTGNPIVSSPEADPRVQQGTASTQVAANSSPARLNATPNPGGLRVSNTTDHPVRVALLAQQSLASSAQASLAPTGKAPVYGQPAHWDFAPGEGSAQGLALSLPEGSLQLKKGDVLVAFAQDGSRRYWGPYVIGETDQPLWNDQNSEWQLSLQR
ncbi:hypothetical protein [Trichocoleus sp. FACHB-591]|uniref:hypothetical protein n=1 Tax=Trichocoleus sp. FACHB-591 TaxID=2692872 RepID=UPI0018F03172|nr:hypothetical protein [Trichocoleus sp. FACHB-591]